MTGILPLVTLHHFTLKCYITGEDILEEKKYIAPGELAHGLKIISQFPRKQKILPGFWPTLQIKEAVPDCVQAIAEYTVL